MIRFRHAGLVTSVILAASALCAFPSVTLRTAASVVIFGPLTLLRPLVVVATVVYAVGLDPSPPVLLVALIVAIPGIAIEPILDHRIAMGLLPASST